MGFFGQVLMSTTRVVDRYKFEYIDDDVDSPLKAEMFDDIFKATKWIIWGSEYLDWYIFDGGPNGSGKVEIRADFLSKVDNGGNVYLWKLDNIHSFIITTSKFGETLEVAYIEYEEIKFAAIFNLSKH